MQVTDARVQSFGKCSFIELAEATFRGSSDINYGCDFVHSQQLDKAGCGVIGVTDHP